MENTIQILCRLSGYEVKDGTALRKLYFPETRRYSEDLDFGVKGAYHGSEAELQDALEDTTRASGIDFEVTKHRELQKEAYLTHYVNIDIQYTACSVTRTRRVWTS